MPTIVVRTAQHRYNTANDTAGNADNYGPHRSLVLPSRLGHCVPSALARESLPPVVSTRATAQHRYAGCETGACEQRARGIPTDWKEGGIGWGGAWSNDCPHPDVRALVSANCIGWD